MDLTVLYEDNHLLVLDKPPLLPTMGVEKNSDSLFLRAKEYIKHKHGKPGNVYLGVVSRLDAFTQGVIVMARTSKAAARLTRQFQDGTVDKRYLAIVSSAAPVQGDWSDYLVKDDIANRMVTVDSIHPEFANAKQARLEFQTLACNTTLRLVEIKLWTGRKHQIRVQFSSRGFPIFNDRKYGWLASSGTASWPRELGIALLAYQLSFDHPTRSQRMSFAVQTPEKWPFATVIRQHLNNLFLPGT